MNLTATERAFIARRRKLLDAWPWVGSALLVMVLGLAAWLWFQVPLMINPWAAINAVSQGSVEETTLVTMAILLPILVLAVMGVLVVVILFFFAALANERRLIAILDRDPETPGP